MYLKVKYNYMSFKMFYYLDFSLIQTDLNYSLSRPPTPLHPLTSALGGTGGKEPAVPMQETQKSREFDPWVGKGMTTHPRLLAWRVP